MAFEFICHTNDGLTHYFFFNACSREQAIEKAFKKWESLGGDVTSWSCITTKYFDIHERRKKNV